MADRRAIARRQRLQAVERKASRRVTRERSVTRETDAWAMHTSGSDVIIDRGYLAYHNVGWIKVHRASLANRTVSVTGGSAADPGYVCLVVTPGSVGWSLEWRSDEPSLNEPDGWRFLVCRAYKTASNRAVIAPPVRQDVIDVGAWMP